MGNLVIVDVETSSLGAWGDIHPITGQLAWGEILSIAWKVVRDWTCVESFYTLVRPAGQRSSWGLEPEAMAVNGISEDRLAEARPFKDIMPQVERALWYADYVCGHNVGFDLGFIRAMRAREGSCAPLLQHTARILDTQKIAARVLPELKGSSGRGPKLTKLAEHFGIKYDAHNAAADVETTRKCLMRMGDIVLPRAAGMAMHEPLNTLLAK